MDGTKKFDIEYPNAAPGVVIADVAMTIHGLVAEVGGTFEATRVIVPDQVEHDWAAVARD